MSLQCLLDFKGVLLRFLLNFSEISKGIPLDSFFKFWGCSGLLCGFSGVLRSCSGLLRVCSGALWAALETYAPKVLAAPAPAAAGATPPFNSQGASDRIPFKFL